MDRETAEVPVLLWLKWTPANLYDIWWQTAYLKYFDNNFVNDVNIGDYRWHFGCVIRQQKEAQSCFNLIGYFPFKTSYECNIDNKNDAPFSPASLYSYTLIRRGGIAAPY